MISTNSHPRYTAKNLNPVLNRRGAIAAIASAPLAAAFLTGCSQSASKNAAGSTEDPSSTDGLDAIRSHGAMTFATEGTWRPWTYHDEDDRLTGFDVEVARLICRELDVEAEFAEGEWDGLFAGLDAGRFDAVANGVEVTPERREAYDFTDPYAYSNTVVITLKDSDITSFEDLSGKTTANTVASTYAEIAESYGANTQSVDDLNQTLELLRQGRIDATLNADVVFYDYINQHPDAPFTIAATASTPTPVSMPVRKEPENASLLQAINDAILAIRESGELAELSMEFFGANITQS